MSDDARPLLAFNSPSVGERVKPGVHPPKVVGPGGRRQDERLSPRFKELTDAFEAKRAELGEGTPIEADPSLVIVLDLAGSVEEFYKAVNKVEGLEFLAEMAGDTTDPDDDFYIQDRGKERSKKAFKHSLYLVMSNARAVDQMVSLFGRWKKDPETKFERGLSKFKNVFSQLVDLRRWGPEDRVRETGLIERWQETLDIVGDSQSSVRVEVELWYRNDRGQRQASEQEIRTIVADCGGRVVNRAKIEEIGYHALLAELPRQQVETVVRQGPQAIRLLVAEDVMFVSPFEPMSVKAVPSFSGSELSFPAVTMTEGKPRIALLDGVPFQNHDALAGRLSIDDPDDFESGYPLTARSHGTAMASLIIHGDLSAPENPLDRKVYVRPIMRHEKLPSDQYVERVSPDTLFVDLLHRAVRRLFAGESGRPPVASSVRVINLSIGDCRRPLVRRMSPVGRLVDWLALEYNVLFIISAGNHVDPISIPAEATSDREPARVAALQAVHASQIVRGILPPGDAMNAVTVGAVHADGSPDPDESSNVWDLSRQGEPALYSATGPGVDRMVKPDIYHVGGRRIFVQPTPPLVVGSDVDLYPANTASMGPGLRVAAPSELGGSNRTTFECGTSHATALVTREASLLFDLLEARSHDRYVSLLPDAMFHPLIVRALLAHACSWGDWQKKLSSELRITSDQRRKLTPFLGYGRYFPDVARSAVNRAVVVAGNFIGLDERHSYDLPLPHSIRNKAEWRRLSITLAYWAPATHGLKRYRAAKVYFTAPELGLVQGERVDAYYRAVQRGSLQHEIIDGSKVTAFRDNATFPVHVECMRDGQRDGKIDPIRYALVVSIETAAETSVTVHDEVRAGLLRLHTQAEARQRSRVRNR
ncbi:S8 family peptidase [Actinomyces naeslundii]|uniref:S8 family peptidase n=1 Tax=Actinomyces naeslundii TaxID=1655 RepID=UPI00094CABC3|nr:S8 family peptidase [Actinomyces naeslundii]OLO81253.1 peptidase S8 [Actinomyces naeslundii]